MAGQNITKDQLVGALERVDDEIDKKADIATEQDFTLASGNWVLDAESGEYVYNLAVAGITERHRADAFLDRDSAMLAAEYGVHTATDTVSGYVVFRADKQPTGDLTGWLNIAQVMPATE